jgi:sporulation protein YlmC with PRC-barrel domain
MQRTHTVVMTSEIIGIDVTNDSSEKLGKIKEIMLDKTNGNVAYIALESKGIFGMGAKFYALPWDSIHYDKSKEKFVTNISKKSLKKSPSFDKAHWPEKAQAILDEKR